MKSRTWAFLLVLVVLVGACATGPSTPAATSPSAGAGTAVAGTAVAARLAPTGATAPIDPAAWALADRLTAANYTADTTSAMVAALARAGIATYSDSSSLSPEVPLTAAASPLALLDFQAHALAVGVWTGASWSGSELDGLMPIPAGSTDAAPASVLLASYVAAVDSPGAALSRAVMAGQNLLNPPTVRFPALVLFLFASDLATGGGQVGPAARQPIPVGGGAGWLAPARGRRPAGERRRPDPACRPGRRDLLRCGELDPHDDQPPVRCPQARRAEQHHRQDLRDDLELRGGRPAQLRRGRDHDRDRRGPRLDPERRRDDLRSRRTDRLAPAVRRPRRGHRRRFRSGLQPRQLLAAGKLRRDDHRGRPAGLAGRAQGLRRASRRSSSRTSARRASRSPGDRSPPKAEQGRSSPGTTRPRATTRPIRPARRRGHSPWLPTPARRPARTSPRPTRCRSPPTGPS